MHVPLPGLYVKVHSELISISAQYHLRVTGLTTRWALAAEALKIHLDRNLIATSKTILYLYFLIILAMSGKVSSFRT